MVIALIASTVFLLAGAAEWLHARRVARIARLAFPGGRPRAWVATAPFLRALAIGGACWGLLTLNTLDGAGSTIAEGATPDRHLIVALDVSPSMYIRDAGPDGKKLRSERARELLTSALSRLDLKRTKVSVVAFYTSAKPVVVDTVDLNVVNNILGDLPLEQAFKEGQTNMYSGVREAVKLAEPWVPGSATLLIVSDGDTLPDTLPPTIPRAIADTLVLGVGNPHRGTQIAGHSSRQDAASLRQLAARLKGVYHDGNAKHLPTTVLAGLRMLEAKDEQKVPLRTIAMAVCGASATIIGGLGPVLAFAGAPAGPRPARRQQSSESAAPKAVLARKPQEPEPVGAA